MLVLHMTVGLGGHGADGPIDDGLFDVLMFGAAFAVIARAIAIPQQRAAWLAMGAGLLCWSLGELYFDLFVEGSSAAGRLPGGRLLPGDVSLSVCRARAAARAHLRELRLSLWLDGLIGGLGGGNDRGGDRAATDRRGGSRRRRHGRDHAGLSDRRPAAADLHDRRARYDRMAPGTRMAADRREHAAERGRRLDLPLPDRHEHLSSRAPWPKPCGPPQPSCWRSPPGPRGRRRGAGGWRIGGWWWCQRSRCSRRWAYSSTATSTTSSRWER